MLLILTETCLQYSLDPCDFNPQKKKTLIGFIFPKEKLKHKGPSVQKLKLIPFLFLTEDSMQN